MRKEVVSLTDYVMMTIVVVNIINDLLPLVVTTPVLYSIGSSAESYLKDCPPGNIVARFFLVLKL